VSAGGRKLGRQAERQLRQEHREVSLQASLRQGNRFTAGETVAMDPTPQASLPREKAIGREVEIANRGIEWTSLNKRSRDCRRAEPKSQIRGEVTMCNIEMASGLRCEDWQESASSDFQWKMRSAKNRKLWSFTITVAQSIPSTWGFSIPGRSYHMLWDPRGISKQSNSRSLQGALV
jgi:hypothetical protein